MLLFPSERERDKRQRGEEKSAPVKSWHDDGFPLFGINRLDVFFFFNEPITLDRRLPCVRAGAQWGGKRVGVGMRALLWFAYGYIYIIKRPRKNNRVQDFNCSDATLH